MPEVIVARLEILIAHIFSQMKLRQKPTPPTSFFFVFSLAFIMVSFHKKQTNLSLLWSFLLIVRNVGNMVPHAQNVDTSSTATEPATLELGCKINGIKHVIVCGHSDCKAMNLLYTVHKSASWSQDKLVESPIKAWLNR